MHWNWLPKGLKGCPVCSPADFEVVSGLVLLVPLPYIKSSNEQWANVRWLPTRAAQFLRWFVAPYIETPKEAALAAAEAVWALCGLHEWTARAQEMYEEKLALQTEARMARPLKPEEED